MHHSVDYIYKALAEKYNLPKEAIKQIEFDLWKSIRHEMGKKEGKEILIANMGAFYIDNWYLNKTRKEVQNRLDELEQRFKNQELDQISYLYKWMGLNYKLRDCNTIIEGIEKRKNRKKGDRGL